ncbi:MAG TPA: cytochrome c [Burkholderiales bacterium]|nr:cytochrome c [Burkholderiales bacterium]
MRLLFVLCSAAPLSALSDDPAPVFDKKFLSNPANIETGRKVWQAQCRHCHGARAYPGKAPHLRPGSYAPEFIYDRVTNGFGKMPSWKAVFSEEERRGVVAYIKSDDFDP